MMIIAMNVRHMEMITTWMNMVIGYVHVMVAYIIGFMIMMRNGDIS